jgi:uncharacterized protein (DUF433 family)
MTNVASTAAEQIIQKNPGVVGGAAKIRQTRIPVWLLVQLRDQLKMNDADIKNYFEPPLTDADLLSWFSVNRNNRFDELVTGMGTGLFGLRHYTRAS